mgnify:CR=1 FL=1
MKLVISLCLLGLTYSAFADEFDFEPVENIGIVESSYETYYVAPARKDNVTKLTPRERIDSIESNLHFTEIGNKPERNSATRDLISELEHKVAAKSQNID